MCYRAILGKLVARTAVHIGTGRGGDVTDDLCRRDVDGNYVIPGTAIGGALRTIATRLAPRLGSNITACCAIDKERKKQCEENKQPCRCWVCQFFGDLYPGEDDSASGASASRLFVAHAVAKLPDNLTARIRDGVGISRITGASARAAAAKFDLEVLPKGTLFDLRLELEDRYEDEQSRTQDEILLAATLAEWLAGRAWLGGRVARGLGAFDLEALQMVEHDLSHPDKLMSFLTTEKPWKTAEAITDWHDQALTQARSRVSGNAATQENIARGFAKTQFTLSFDGPFLSNDTLAAAQAGFDHVPLMDTVGTNGKPMLSGASLRGVLRTHAEKIARTLATLKAQDLQAFGKICPACDPFQRNVPREYEKKENDEEESGDEKQPPQTKIPLASCDELLKGKKIPTDQEVTDEQLCLGCRLFGSTRKGSRFIVEDAVAVDEINGKVLDFLAIDRFTGGGKDGAKFDAFAAWKPRFEVTLHLENPQRWELGWLALVLRDLAEGMLTLGFGGAKGFGRGKIDHFSVQYGFISENDFAGPIELARANAQASSGIYRCLTWDTRDSAQKQELCRVAKDWVKAFNDEIRAFERGDNKLPLLAKDTFFAESNEEFSAEKLYGKARVLS